MEFDIIYVPQKVIKGRVLADFLAAHLISDESPLIMEVPDEVIVTEEVDSHWEMYFDEISQSFSLIRRRCHQTKSRGRGPFSYPI